MKLFMRLSLLLISGIVVFSSCKKSAPKQVKFIPKEAVFVATINTKSLQDKLVKSQATLENLIKSLTDANDTAIDKGKKEWEELKNSGIDVDENIYISVVQKGGGMTTGQESTVSAAVGGLKDASKFEAYIKKKDPGAEIKKDNGFSYALKDDKMVAWGKDVIIFMSYSKGTTGMMEFDTTTNTYNVNPGQANIANDLIAEMKSYFNLKEDASMVSIAEFRDLAAQKVDGSFWFNHASTTDNIPIPLPKLKELFENSYTAATINFEDGKIVMKSKTYSSKAMAVILEKYSGSSVNLDLVKNYPSNNINGFFIASFNPDFINGIVQYLELGGFVDGFITKAMGTNNSLKDVLKSIKGDMALVVSDVGATWADPAQPMKTRFSSMGKVLLNIPVGDKVQFNRLMDKLVEQQMMVKADNQYELSPALSSMGFKVSVDDKNLLLASDSTIIMNYKAGTGKSNIDSKLLEDFKGKSSVGFVDIEKIMNTSNADSSNAASFNSAKNTFKNIKGYTENFNGKFIEGRLEINMKDDKENSLTSLLKFFVVAGNDIEKNKRNNELNINIDSSAVE